MTAQNGEIQSWYRYDAFGNILGSTEELPNRIRYTGQQYDQATEQYYLRARYYTPALGRFLQEDVYQGDGLNLYAYCGNNPVVYCDPSGYKKAKTKTPCEMDELGDGQDGTRRVNSKGDEYPDIIDLKTGERLEFPEGNLDVIPEEDRAKWYASQSRADQYRTDADEILCKKDFIDEWYARGYTTPEGGWNLYDIHHIKPRSRGGNNSFDNLTPVLRTLHRKLLNVWWKFFGGK